MNATRGLRPFLGNLTKPLQVLTTSRVQRLKTGINAEKPGRLAAARAFGIFNIQLMTN